MEMISYEDLDGIRFANSQSIDKQKNVHPSIYRWYPENKFDLMKQQLSAFSYGMLKDISTLFKMMDKFDLTREDIVEFTEYITQEKIKWSNHVNLMKRKKRELDALMPKCPECGHYPFKLQKFTVPQGNGNVKGWKSMFYCKACSHEEFHLESHDEMIEKLVEEKKDNGS